MNKKDLKKYIYQNMKCRKSIQMLKEIINKYGFPYMVGAIYDQPLSIQNNSYATIIKDPNSITWNYDTVLGRFHWKGKILLKV